ncbi:MAG: M67 family metallopeptidase [Pseudomonadota bacterium]
MTLEISRSVLAGIAAEAAASPRLEICGLLFGQGGRIDTHRPCRNVAARPQDSFEIDPATLIAALRAERNGGARIAGCYHSHPAGSAEPSIRDAEAATPNGWVWLIVGSHAAECYRAVGHGRLHGRFDPVAHLSVQP